MKPLVLALALCTAVTVTAQRGPAYQPNQREFYEQVDPPAQGAVKLARDTVQHLYVGAGYSTYLEFPAKPSIERVFVGASKLIVATTDATRNAIVITPMVASGHTNMTVVFQGIPYVWEIHIRNAGEVNYRMTYSVPSPSGAATLPYGPPMVPSSIPVAEIMKKIQSYGQTALSAKDARDIFYQSISKPITWNGQLLTIADAFGFVRQNLIVLRVHRRNVSDSIKYLNSKQINVFVANTPFPATVNLQASPQLYPGQAEVLYLFLQGYGLTVDNDFSIQLPPDSQAVEAYLQRK